jgi:hypothetical protein
MATWCASARAISISSAANDRSVTKRTFRLPMFLPAMDIDTSRAVGIR